MTGAAPASVAAWVEGWAISRGVRAPIPIPGGWRVEVGLPDQARRFVFPAAGDEVREAALIHVGPHVFLKVFASAALATAGLVPGWEVVSSAFVLMSASKLTFEAEVAPGYAVSVECDGRAWQVRALDSDGTVAASGRMAVASGAAIFDRIVTDAAHRRRGLGKAVMAELGRIARDHGAAEGLLVATAEGRALYETLGWTVRAPYTSILWTGGPGNRVGAAV